MKITKRNVNLYLKEKSTLTAFIFLSISLLFFFLSFIKTLSYIKGVRNDFEIEKIETLYSNGSDTTYLVSDNNNLYYSLYKNYDKSHLNKYTGTKSLANEYGDPTSHYYNFIYVDYKFDSKIVDVIGRSDLITSGNGYTLVLTSYGSLYYIDNYINEFIIKLTNIKKVKILYNDLLVLTKDNKLYKTNTSTFELTYLDVTSPDDFTFKDQDTIYYLKNNTLYDLDNNIIDVNIKKIVNNGSANILITTDSKIKCFDYLSSSITFTSNEIENPYGIINDVYISGDFSFVFNIDDKLYYLGATYINDENFTNLNYINGNFDNIYYSRNGTIAIKNGYLYLYNVETNVFEGMYKNIMVYYVVRYLSLFVFSMLVLYFILSFIESNKRYNRYFSATYTNKEIYDYK